MLKDYLAIKSHLENRDGVLHMSEIPLSNIANKFGTPLYIYDADRMIQNVKRLKAAFQEEYENFKIFVAIKANSNLSLLKMLQKENCGADCSSQGELFIADKAGFSWKDIIYTGNYQSMKDIEEIFEYDSEKKKNVKQYIINLDDISTFKKILSYDVPELISFRLNPGVGNGEFKQIVCGGENVKFGMSQEKILTAYASAKKAGVKKFGIHMMTGSSILEAEYFRDITKIMMATVVLLKEKLNIDVDFVDIGGGFGIPYSKDQNELDIKKTARLIANEINQQVNKFSLKKPVLFIEPGRYIFADAGILLTKVSSVKEDTINGKKFKFVGLDAGMNNFMRSALYGAKHIIIAVDKVNDLAVEKINFCGQICESTDVFAKAVDVPYLEENDVVAILDAGAYGFSMSSNYNGKLKCAEVMIKDGDLKIIRKKETYDDLCRNMCGCEDE